MNILVDTDEGVACICGDVIYDIAHQLVDPHLQVMELDPAVTGNHGGSKRGEKAAIRKALVGSRFVLPAHDRPAVVERGRVVGRTFDSVPGDADRQRRVPGQAHARQRRARCRRRLRSSRCAALALHLIASAYATSAASRSPARRSRSARAASSGT